MTLYTDEEGGRRHDSASLRPSTSSDVVMIDESNLPASASAMPTVSNMNVHKSKVHIGSKFVSITQNVHNTEVVKGQFLGLDLVHSKNGRRLRCGVAVFVCWTLVVTCGLVIYLIQVTLSAKQSRMDLDIHEDWYLRRAEWQALPAYEIEFLNLPVKYAIIGHSAYNKCDDKYKCISSMLAIQRDHFIRGFGDIGPNFLIGGDGSIFEGRGANVVGAMVKWWNLIMISIMFIGDYTHDEPDQIQFYHLSVLLDKLVDERVLLPDYILTGHCQVATDIVSPGPNIMHHLNNFTHWDPTNSSTCLPECRGGSASEITETYSTEAYQLHLIPNVIDLPCLQCTWNAIQSTSKAERLTCAVACIAMIICIVLVVHYTTKVEEDAKAEEVDVAPHEWNITRDMWLAQPYNNTDIIEKYGVLKLVIIQHTVSTECYMFKYCAAAMRNLQNYFFEKYDYDLPYNFVVGNDGRIYEGRGWHKEGAHTQYFNRCSLGIGFVGDYREEVTPHTSVLQIQLDRALRLLEEAVSLGYLEPNYVVVGAKDLKNDTKSPGSNLHNAIKKWSHYDHNYRYLDKNCDQIQGII